MGKKIMNIHICKKTLYVLAVIFAVCVPLFGVYPVAAAAMEPADIAKTLLKYMFEYMGIIIIFIGAIQLALAFSQEDANRKARALMVCVTGAALWGLTKGIEYLFTGASDTPSVSNVPDPEMRGLVGDIAKWIPQLGIVVLVWGAFQFVLAFKNDNAGEKIKALKLMFAGGALWQIVNAMNIILGPVVSGPPGP
ncbi:MAG: hypothetical protein LBL34_07080 [Clostridiales bacterium]|nr:hypothetical protein [Clostridiales bacterium]